MSSPTLLIVEDDAAALMLTRRVLSREIPHAQLEVAVDGEEAINKVISAADAGNLPVVMLLDWNLPKKHGREVLAEIRKDPRTKSLPVVIVTSSNADPDKNEASSLGANGFVHKSLVLSEFRQALAETCKQYLPEHA